MFLSICDSLPGKDSHHCQTMNVLATDLSLLTENRVAIIFTLVKALKLRLSNKNLLLLNRLYCLEVFPGGEGAKAGREASGLQGMLHTAGPEESAPLSSEGGSGNDPTFYWVLQNVTQPWFFGRGTGCANLPWPMICACLSKTISPLKPS